MPPPHAPTLRPDPLPKVVSSGKSPEVTSTVPSRRDHHTPMPTRLPPHQASRTPFGPTVYRAGTTNVSAAPTPAAWYGRASLPSGCPDRERNYLPAQELPDRC